MVVMIWRIAVDCTSTYVHEYEENLNHLILCRSKRNVYFGLAYKRICTQFYKVTAKGHSVLVSTKMAFVK